MASGIVGGIEGGASHSTAVLINPQGEVIAVAKGMGTNHLMIGKQECYRRIAELINEAKLSANIPLDSPIEAIGLSLSGCEHEESNKELVRGLEKAYPQLANQYAIGSDTDGSIATVSNKGGVVCISGTGSNTLLINPDGQKAQCGGWGYILGDEGSAYSVSLNAIKYCFDNLDNFQEAPYPIEKTWALIKQFFKIETQSDLLEVFYQNFDKSKISLLCKSVADLAREEGDQLAKHIFQQAGRDLAKGIAAVAQKASKDLTDQPGGLKVVCVGSVWLSWDLLQCGFTSHLRSTTSINELTLLRLNTELGVGAALMAADRLNLRIDRDYSKNSYILALYKGETACTR